MGGAPAAGPWPSRFSGAYLVGPADPPQRVAWPTALSVALACRLSFLAGRALDAFYPLAYRLLRVEAGHFVETHLLEHRERSPVDFFPLV